MSENLTICDVSAVLISKDAQITLVLAIIIAVVSIVGFVCKEILREFIQDWFSQRREKSKRKQNIIEIPTKEISEFHDYLDNMEFENNYSNSHILEKTDPAKYIQSYFQWKGEKEKFLN